MIILGKGTVITRDADRPVSYTHLHDVVNAQRSFLCYKACREFCQTQLMLGKTFSSLVARTA